MNEMISDRPMSGQVMTNKGVSQTNKIENKQIDAFMDIRINADDQSSCRTACYWLIILAAILIAAVLSAKALPHEVLQLFQEDSLEGTNLANCRSTVLSSGNSLVCDYSGNNRRMGQYVTNLQRLNQFLVFYLYINSYSLPTSTDQSLNFKLYTAKRVLSANGDVSLELGDLMEQSQISMNEEMFMQYRYLGFVNDLEDDMQFYWEVSFGPYYGSMARSYSIKSFVVNPNYSYFCIALRLAFMAISVAFCLIYASRYRHIQSNRSLPEQKIVLLLSLATVAFNDPFYILTILYPNIFTTFMSTFFTWNFITLIFVTWGFFLQRIKQQPGKVKTQLATKSNIAAVALFYIINMTYRVSLALVMSSNRPFTEPASASSPIITIMYGISTVTFLAATVYILMLYCQLWNMDGLLWRHTLFKNLSLFFYLLVFVIFFIGGFDVFQYSAGMVMFTYTFTNIFSFYMQFMYMPTDRLQAIQGQPQAEQDINKIMANFSIGDDDDNITIDLEMDYDVLVECQGSKIFYNENKAVSYLGQNLKKSVLEENDEIKASKISCQSAKNSQIKQYAKNSCIKQQKEEEQSQQSKQNKQQERGEKDEKNDRVQQQNMDINNSIEVENYIEPNKDSSFAHEEDIKANDQVDEIVEE